MKMFSKDGVEMVDVKSVDRDGDRLVLKTKVMGSMPATIVLRPQDLWEAMRLLSWPLVLHLPGMLYRGWQLARAPSGAKA